jgi:hypothetical protein
MLHYETDDFNPAAEHDQGTNGGLFYQCTDFDGRVGVYLFLTPTETPPSCRIITLHSHTLGGGGDW